MRRQHLDLPVPEGAWLPAANLLHQDEVLGLGTVLRVLGAERGGPTPFTRPVLESVGGRPEEAESTAPEALAGRDEGGARCSRRRPVRSTRKAGGKPGRCGARSFGSACSPLPWLPGWP